MARSQSFNFGLSIRGTAKGIIYQMQKLIFHHLKYINEC